jgi:hypothetical protein
LPCPKFDDLRKPGIGSTGVKIDAAEPWPEGFRQALRFWNTVLNANFYEETDLNACSVRIIEGGPDILKSAVAARSHMTDWANFQGKIAVSQVETKRMNSAEIYSRELFLLPFLVRLVFRLGCFSGCRSKRQITLARVRPLSKCAVWAVMLVGYLAGRLSISGLDDHVRNRRLLFMRAR